MPARGAYKTGTATTTAVNGNQATLTFTVPQGKVWIFDTLAVSVNLGVNTVELLVAGVKIWEDLVNVTTEQVLDLLTRYARALQAEASETVQLRITTNEAVAKTLTGKAWVLEY